MSLFQKRDSLIQNIAYMGIMAAINVIAVVIMNFVPFLFLPLALFMPLTSTVVTLFCKKRYFIIYAIATTGLCFLVSINNISDTLFYVIPSVISGFAFGMMIEYKFPSIVSIFVAGLICCGLSYSVIPLIEFIYGQNMIEVVATIFGLQDYEYLGYVVPGFILVIGLIQSTITYLLIISELPKLGVNNEEKVSVYFYNGFGILGSLLSLLAFFFFKEFCLFFLVFAVFFGVYEVTIRGFNKEKVPLIINGVCVIVFILIFALSYQYIEKPLGIVLINILFDMFLITGLVYNTFTKRDELLE